MCIRDRFYAGKTASDGTNRYIWGWCPTRAGNEGAYEIELTIENQYADVIGFRLYKDVYKRQV